MAGRPAAQQFEAPDWRAKIAAYVRPSGTRNSDPELDRAKEARAARARIEKATTYGWGKDGALNVIYDPPIEPTWSPFDFVGGPQVAAVSRAMATGAVKAGRFIDDALALKSRSIPRTMASEAGAINLGSGFKPLPGFRDFSQPVRPTSPEERYRQGIEALGALRKHDVDVPNAMYRPDVGDITFRLGDEGKRGSGFRHIIGYGRDPADVVKTLAFGNLQQLKREGADRAAVIDFGEHRAILQMHYYGKRETWVLTGFEKRASR
jgi:hypothetical protein